MCFYWQASLALMFSKGEKLSLAAYTFTQPAWRSLCLCVCLCAFVCVCVCSMLRVFVCVGVWVSHARPFRMSIEKRCCEFAPALLRSSVDGADDAAFTRTHSSAVMAKQHAEAEADVAVAALPTSLPLALPLCVLCCAAASAGDATANLCAFHILRSTEHGGRRC